MAINLSDIAKIEKNKLYSAEVWLLLLEIDLTKWGLEVYYFVRNNEDITWNGITWIASNFEVDVVDSDSKGSINNVNIHLSNVNNVVGSLVQQSQGGLGAPVVLRLITTADLNNPVPVVEELFEVISTNITTERVSFTLGAPNPFLLAFPRDVYLQNFCRWEFKGKYCQYDGPYTTCLHTLADCKIRGNLKRFGGFPGCGNKGVII